MTRWRPLLSAAAVAGGLSLVSFGALYAAASLNVTRGQRRNGFEAAPGRRR